MVINLNVIAKTTFAIIAAIGLVCTVGYLNNGDSSLLDLAKSIAQWTILGSCFIALLIHLPRFMR